MNKERKFIRKMDIMIIAVILMVAVVFYFGYSFLNPKEETAYAEILLDGKVVKTVSIDEDTHFYLPQNSHVEFEVVNHAIRFKASDCPDQICVHSGFLSHSGQMAACLPNRLAIRIMHRADDAGQPDIIAS